eukprot:2967726-Rhodomonas_salina.1
MAAIAAQAEQAAATAAQTVVNNQVVILQQIADTQQFLRQQLEERDSKNKQSDCPEGLAAYNPWAVTVESYLVKKSRARTRKKESDADSKNTSGDLLS